MNAKIKSNSSLNQLDIKFTVSGLQPQIFRNMSMKDVDNIQQLTKEVKLQTQIQKKSYNSIKSIQDESDSSDEDFSQKQSGLQKIFRSSDQWQQLLKETKIKLIDQKLSLEQVDGEMTKIYFQLRQQKSVSIKYFLRRESINTTSMKYHQLDRSPHQTTLATNDLPSNDSALFLNRPLKLPQLY